MTDETLSLREARQQYFRDNGFGEDGGYGATWVDFSLGPIPVPFPNTPGRVAAVGFHDLHHVLTGYPTTTLGEFTISAWEVGAGCGRFHAAWGINLGGMAAGLLVAPRTTIAAWRRGRRDTSLYRGAVDGLLDLTVAEARQRFLAPRQPPEAWEHGERGAFVVTALVALAVGAANALAMLLVLPIGLGALAVRRWRGKSEASGSRAAPRAA